MYFSRQMKRLQMKEEGNEKKKRELKRKELWLFI
jgi:hypothetical protein